jgi:hypothetical protein
MFFILHFYAHSFRLGITILDISKKECRDENPYPWNVSTRFLENAYLISGDVYWALDFSPLLPCPPAPLPSLRSAKLEYYQFLTGYSS